MGYTRMDYILFYMGVEYTNVYKISCKYKYKDTIQFPGL